MRFNPTGKYCSQYSDADCKLMLSIFLEDRNCFLSVALIVVCITVRTVKSVFYILICHKLP